MSLLLLFNGSGTYTRSYTEAFSLSDAAVKATGKAANDAVTLADTVSRATGKVALDTFTVADIVFKNCARVLADPFTAADSINRATSRPVSETFTVADNFFAGHGFFTAISDAFSLADSLARAAGKNVAEALTLADIAITRAMVKTLTDPFAVAESLLRSTARLLIDAWTLGDNANRSAAHALADSVAMADVLTFSRGYFTVLTDASTVVEAFVRSFARLLADVVTFGESFASMYSPSGTLQFFETFIVSGDTLARSAGKFLFDSVTPTSFLQKAFRKAALDTFALLESFAQSIVQAVQPVFPWRRFYVPPVQRKWQRPGNDKIWKAEKTQRKWQSEGNEHLWKVEKPVRAWEANNMLKIFTTKKSGSTEDFLIDWSALASADPIISSSWSVPIPNTLTVVRQGNGTTSATIRLGDGAVGTQYAISNTVTLTSGQVEVQDLFISVD